MPMLESHSPRLVRWIARQCAGTNPAGPVSAEEIRYIRGEVEDLPGDVPSEAAWSAAWAELGPRLQDLAIGGRPDAVDSYAEAAAAAARER